MKRIDKLSEYINWIMTNKVHPGAVGAYEDVSFKLISMGGKENSISYEIEQYIEEERIIYTVDIKRKDKDNE